MYLTFHNISPRHIVFHYIALVVCLFLAGDTKSDSESDDSTVVTSTQEDESSSLESTFDIISVSDIPAGGPIPETFDGDVAEYGSTIFVDGRDEPDEITSYFLQHMNMGVMQVKQTHNTVFAGDGGRGWYVVIMNSMPALFVRYRFIRRLAMPDCTEFRRRFGRWRRELRYFARVFWKRIMNAYIIAGEYIKRGEAPDCYLHDVCNVQYRSLVRECHKITQFDWGKLRERYFAPPAVIMNHNKIFPQLILTRWSRSAGVRRDKSVDIQSLMTVYPFLKPANGGRFKSKPKTFKNYKSVKWVDSSDDICFHVFPHFHADHESYSNDAFKLERETLAAETNKKIIEYIGTISPVIDSDSDDREKSDSGSVPVVQPAKSREVITIDSSFSSAPEAVESSMAVDLTGVESEDSSSQPMVVQTITPPANTKLKKRPLSVMVGASSAMVQEQ